MVCLLGGESLLAVEEGVPWTALLTAAVTFSSCTFKEWKLSE
jgi:hypothetical protein